MDQFKMLIDGEWCQAAGGEWFETQNPYTGKTWALVPRGGKEDANAAVTAAHRAFTSGEWPTYTPTQRGHLLRRLGDLIKEKAEYLADCEVRDNGKLKLEMFGQLQYVPEFYYYNAGLADKIEGRVIPIDKPGIFNYTRHEPLGVVACITPWNSPILLLSFKLAPALAAGNTIVVKPSEFTSTSTLELAKLFEEAGFPPGVFNVVTGYGPDVGEPLVVDDRVQKVCFTGSEMGGVRVYQAAAAGLKAVTLELGGKSPNIVFEDANLDNAVKGAVSGIFAASGQTCIAGSRLLLQRSIHDAFVEKLVDFARTAKLGDPSQMDTQVGPVTTPPQFEKVLKYIDIGKEEGAEIVLGGGPSDRPELGDGWFVEPTIFRGVNNQMRIAQEEIFGPVLSIIPFDDQDEAVSIANDVLYGLASGVWTQNLARAHQVAAALQAGTVWVNTYRAVSMTSPFGGWKRSGLGHENGSRAIEQFLQEKSVWINTSDEFPNPFGMR